MQFIQNTVIYRGFIFMFIPFAVAVTETNKKNPRL